MIDPASFIAWIAKPEAYNWITLIGALSAVATAIFTGYAAFTAWSDRRHRMSAEWTHEFFPLPHIRVTFHLTNSTPYVLLGEAVEVSGPIKEVLPWLHGKIDEKHGSFPAERAPFRFEIEANTRDAASFVVLMDPERVQEAASTPLSVARSSLGKLLWRLFRWRLPAGASLSIVVIARRRSAPMRPIRFTHTIRIHAETAQQIAANMANKAV